MTEMALDIARIALSVGLFGVALGLLRVAWRLLFWPAHRLDQWVNGDRL